MILKALQYFICRYNNNPNFLMYLILRPHFFYYEIVFINHYCFILPILFLEAIFEKAQLAMEFSDLIEYEMICLSYIYLKGIRFSSFQAYLKIMFEMIFATMYSFQLRKFYKMLIYTHIIGFYLFALSYFQLKVNAFVQPFSQNIFKIC